LEEDLKQPIAILIICIAFALLVREVFPKRATIVRNIPQITTVYDTVTVYRRPDTVKIATTDTVNITIRETLVDTVLIDVESPPSERELRYPVLSLRLGTQFNDTGSIETFNIRDGRITQSVLFIPGMLTSLDVTDEPVPRMNFAPFPEPRGTSFWDKLKFGAIGFGTCTAISLIKR